VRINLLDQDRKQRKRRKRSRRYEHETAFVQPQVRSRQVQKHRSRPRPAPQSAMPEVLALSPAQRRIRWRIVLRRFPVALFLAGVIGVIVYTSTAEEFFVYADDTQIVGLRHLDASTIYQVAGVDEQNIFWVQPEQVAERIRQLDGVKGVRVRCDLLPARVTIEVQEREPVVMWRALAQERDWWLDEEGVVLPYHGDPHAPGMIFVVDSSERHLQVADRLEPEGIVQSVQQLAAALPETQIFFYQADRGLSFTQRVDGGEWPVYVGTSEDLARKIRILQALTDYFSSRGLRPRYVDVRWASHPVYGQTAAEPAAGGQ
jgi:cell division septal protein FtsQ